MRATALVSVVLLSGLSAFGQNLLTLPAPMPQVEFVDYLPNVIIEVYAGDSKGVNLQTVDSLHTSYRGSSPSKFIVLDYVSYAPEPVVGVVESAKKQIQDCSRPLKKGDNLWNVTKKQLISQNVLSSPSNRIIMYHTREGARLNSIKVPEWRIKGSVLHTKVPVGFKLDLSYLYFACRGIK